MKVLPTFQMKDRYQYLAVALMLLGLITLGLTFYLDPIRAWTNFLINNFYFMSLGLSGVLILALLYICKGAWASVLKRIPEAMMACLPVAFVLMLLLGFGIHSLYHWSHADAVAHDALLQHKEPYLNVTFFMIRMVFYFVVWIAFARLFRRVSLRQDAGLDLPFYYRNTRYSSLFIVFFALTFSFASYDWLMSLEPHWFSTIFSIYTFSSLFVHGIAAMTLVVILLMERGYLKGFVNENHLHDLGKLLLAFTTFWAYIWFSQYMLIWYANIPEETSYFILRTDPDWIWLFWLNLAINWGIPFVILLPRVSKRSPAILKRVCITLLIGYWLDLYLRVAPGVGTERQIGLIEIFIALGYAALFFWITGRALAKAPLIARNDPYLQESLHLHQ